MRRTVFDEDHEAFRQMLRAFIAAEVVPNYDQWFAEGIVPRELYAKLADLGIFGISVDEEYGGAGLATHKFHAIQSEETARAGVTFGGSGVHVLLALPYIKMLGTEQQKKRYLPDFATGEVMWALAMTEPGSGSDLAGMRSSAKLSADGTHYVLNGAKTFITGGVHADRMIVLLPAPARRRTTIAASASPSLRSTRTPPVTRSVASSTSSACTPPTPPSSPSPTSRSPSRTCSVRRTKASAIWARTSPPSAGASRYGAYAQAKAAVRFAQEYVEQRTIFGKPVASFQNTKFELAACKAEVDAAEAVTDRALEALDAGELTPAEAASAKLFCTEVAHRVVDRCLQLHGGYGFINEYPIARLYADNRVNRIYGGTSEVMKTIIAKDMGL